ncbi:MAG: glycoside hydrolase family 3 C-terminal domain-containing protein [Microthrixaceae bacterium]
MAETTTDPAAPTGRGGERDGWRRQAERIVDSLDRRARVRLLSGSDFWHLESLPDHGITSIMVTDGPHGLRRQPDSGDHLGLAGSLPATCYPTAATLGSTWDREVLERVGRAIGVEAVQQGVAVVLGPGLNIKRHPAGGRCFEYLSEDPHLSGHLAAAMVRGVQSTGTGACLKHFAANNQESFRLVVDTLVDERTLRELYLTGFEIAVTESAPETVMCSYNLVNGVYASEHHELLTTILREEWGFDGLVMSDWGAVNDRSAGIAAGLDLEMPGSRGACDPEVIEALESGRLDDEAVRVCARRVVELSLAHQHRGPSVEFDPDAHHQVARQAAVAGSVLLRNTGVLPLRDDRRIAVIGSFATMPRYQGAGSSQVRPTRLDTAWDAIRVRCAAGVADGRVRFADGYAADTGETDAERLEEALEAAASADVTVLFAGLPARAESEGFDRTTLDLPVGQRRLLEALAATETPLVVVLNNGGVVHLDWAERVDGLLECWLGGQAGGSAVVDVLFGDAEPGGRLAESVPCHVTQLPADRNFPGLPRQVQYREGFHVGYRFHDTAGVPARFPFGFGLGYTTFDWSEAALDVAGGDTEVTVRVKVLNTGERRGSDVVQVYVRDVVSTVARPDKELKGFAKVHLDPGESTTATIRLDRRAFAHWDPAAHEWVVEPGDFEIVVARNSADPVATLSHRVAPADPVARTDRAAAPRRSTGTVAGTAELEAMMGGPIPEPIGARPFHRNSTLADIESTQAGRLLAAAVMREGVRRAAKEFPDPDEATLHMVRAALREGPLRGLVLMGGGVMSFATLDSLIATFNGGIAGEASKAVRRLGRRVAGLRRDRSPREGAR